MLEFPLEAVRAAHGLKRLVRRGVPFRTDTYEMGDHLIWGATARIVADLLARVPDGPAEEPGDRAGRVGSASSASQLGRVGREHLDRDVPRRRRAAHHLRAAREHILAQRAGPLVEQPAHRRVDELLAQHPQPPRVQLRAAVPVGAARAATPPPSRPPTPPSASRCGRGRRRTAPRPPPRSPPTRAGSRVVPRTACPAASSSRASAWPRPPQPTIRTRAISRPRAGGPRGRGTPPRARASRAARG